MLKLDQLSCELLIFIINKLDYDYIEILKLRLINKRLSFLIKNNIKFKELNIIDYKLIDNNYSNSNLSIINKLDQNYNYRNIIYDYNYSNHYRPINYFKSNLFKLLFNKIKYLKLNINLGDFDYNILNEFELLIDLNISYLELNKDLLLKLSNLIRLEINYSIDQYRKKSFEIDAIKLKNLHLNHLDQIEFKYFESIEYIEINDYRYNLNYINKFKNLKFLFLKELNNEFNLELLNDDLKELNFTSDYRLYNNTNNSKLLYYNLLEQKQKLNRINLIISLFGIELIDRMQFNRIDFKFNESFLYNQVNLIQSPMIKFLKFDNINKLSNHHYLSEKLINLQALELNHLEDGFSLINLLTKLSNVNKLKLYFCLLDNEFYRKLHPVTKYLNFLEILWNKIEINLENILINYNYLYSFETDHYLNLEFVIDYIKSNRHLHYLGRFKNGIKEYTITKIDKDKFDLRYDLKIELDYNDLKNQLLSI